MRASDFGVTLSMAYRTATIKLVDLQLLTRAA